MQLLSTKVAGEVILRQDNQHLTASVHIVGHVLDDGFSNLEVPAVNAVGDWVFLKNWDEILSDPAKVFWAVANKQSVYKFCFLEALCQQ